ncbi:uncharacterized protein CcaverHIS019_0511090 [Cutaneotrichosporon cavernicola]|uniref:Rab-GAP TBC domain-containing protein n=1 Tax=Cutaneotrichosporon cavernicola TaxID=279322 RepID=A0AA48QXK3_9TREE|nr:uncharacterized protein CcaverHIS019_0511090 [Cutaneotrichosporon cavernicola]BEI93481.1 hypothetical protein CcaverHIS019_0511090 [Cutaneotrichosporon cavernicola]
MSSPSKSDLSDLATSPSETKPALPSTFKTAPKARTVSASSSTGGPSRVRAAASLWENKSSSSPASKPPGRPVSPGKLPGTGRMTPSSSSGRVTPSSRPTATRSNSSGGRATPTSTAKRTPLSPKLSIPNGQANGSVPGSFKSTSSELDMASPRSATPPPLLASPVPPVPSLPAVHSPVEKEKVDVLSREPTPPPVASPVRSPVSPATSTLLPAAPISPTIDPSPSVPEAKPTISSVPPESVIEANLQGNTPLEESAKNDAKAVKTSPKADAKAAKSTAPQVESKTTSKVQRKAAPKFKELREDKPKPAPVIIKKPEIKLEDKLKTAISIKPVEVAEEPTVARDDATRALPNDDQNVALAEGSCVTVSLAPAVSPASPAAPVFQPPPSAPTTPVTPSRVAGVTSLFSRVLPASTSTSTLNPPATPTVLSTMATPPRDSSKSAMKDEHLDDARLSDEQWATARVKGSETSGSSNKDRESTPAPSPTPTPTTKSRFFSSATSAFSTLQLPSVSLPSLSATTSSQSRSADIALPLTEASHLTPAPAMPSAGVGTSPGSSWRTTMTHFLQRTQSASTTPPPVPTTPSRNGSGSIQTLNRADSSSDLYHHMREVEQEPLGEGFERVRNEMEVAAREIRRERVGRGISLGTDENVDWAFWGTVVQDYDTVANERPKELSRAIQQGIPAVIRGPIWQLMSASKNANLEETYKTLLKQTSPYEKNIQKDINRTFPSHKFFQGASGQEGLFVVCKAYSLYDPDVGYTQGLAFIVATLLLNMPDEEAFCVLVRLMTSYNLRSHYLDNMPGLQLRLFQFDRLVEDVLPLLNAHLVRKGIKSSMYASQWLMTLFSYRFPLSLVYRVTDIVLAEGTEAVFRFAVALLRKCEDQLLKLEFEELLAFLTGDLYECYRIESEDGEEHWRSNDFVRDAYQTRITPLMLDQYESEWNEKCRIQTEHLRQLEGYARETEQLRGANRHLSSQVKNLEGSLATMNQEHVELVRQLVLAKIAKEDMETELVKYKAMCAALAQGREEDVDLPHIASRGSHTSLTPLPPSRRGSAVVSPTSHSPNLSPQRSAASGHASPITSPTERVPPGLAGRAD